jgi:hypothetical protein
MAVGPDCWHRAGLSKPTLKYVFDPDHQWCFDYAWPEAKLALDVELWASGQADTDKHNAACLAGWRLLRVTGKMLRDGRALLMLKQAMGDLNGGDDDPQASQ